MGLHPKEVHRVLRRQHIFTHIRWDMEGVFLEVREPAGALIWMTKEEIENHAALPTAFRQFWEEIKNV